MEGEKESERASERERRERERERERDWGWMDSIKVAPGKLSSVGEDWRHGSSCSLSCFCISQHVNNSLWLGRGLWAALAHAAVCAS